MVEVLVLVFMLLITFMFGALLFAFTIFNDLQKEKDKLEINLELVKLKLKNREQIIMQLYEQLDDYGGDYII